MHHTKKYHNYHSRGLALVGEQILSWMLSPILKNGDNMRRLNLMTRDMIGAMGDGSAKAVELVNI